MSNSEEEEIARDYICFGNPDATIIVVDATCLERNLNLVYQTMEITNNIIVCVNLLDEAKKKGINIDLDKLSSLLGVPVVGTIARKKKSLKNLLDTVFNVCTKKIIPSPKKICYNFQIETCISKLEAVLKNCFSAKNSLYRWISLKLIDGESKILHSIEKHINFSIKYNENIQQSLSQIYDELSIHNITKNNFKDIIVSSIVKQSEFIRKQVCIFNTRSEATKDRKIDKILTSKIYGIPIMILFLGLIFWITIIGANYPSQLLFNLFGTIQEHLLNFANYIQCPEWLSNMLILGIYRTLTWVVSVMLPPMAEYKKNRKCKKTLISARF